MAAPWILPAISLALSGTSMIVSGIGEKRARDVEADKAIEAFRIGRVRARQTDAALREDLRATIGNIRAIMASRGQATDTPTAEAFLRGESEAADRDRRIAVASARLQANQSALDAMTLRRAGRFALFGGVAGGLGEFAQIAGLDFDG